METVSIGSEFLIILGDNQLYFLSLEKSLFDKASHDRLHLYPYSHKEKNRHKREGMQKGLRWLSF